MSDVIYSLWIVDLGDIPLELYSNVLGSKWIVLRIIHLTRQEKCVLMCKLFGSVVGGGGGEGGGVLKLPASQLTSFSSEHFFILSFGFLSRGGNLHCKLFVVETFCSKSFLYSSLGRTVSQQFAQICIGVKRTGPFISVFLIILHSN